MYRNSQLRKAVAFAVFVKAHTRNSIVKDWTINKLHALTGVSAEAVKARIATLRDMELVEEVGIGKKHLVFKSLHSHTAHRNIQIKDIEFKQDKNLKKNAYAQEVKNVEHVLTAILLVEIQRRKDFAKQMIQQKQNPRSKKEYKDAVKVCNNFGFGENFVNKGISYKFMAAKLGISMFKAVQIVKFAVECKLIKKVHKAYKQITACSKYIEDMITNYTFVYRNKIYKIPANRYAVV